MGCMGSFRGRNGKQWSWPAVAAIVALLVAQGCSNKRSRPDEGAEREVAQKTEEMASPGDKQQRKQEAAAGPRRIILLIGDGMGTSSLSGATYAGGEALELSTMERLNFITTHSHEYVTTDSAASATAFATGQKTHYQGVSVKPGTRAEQEKEPSHHMKTALETAEGRGWKTGLVASVRITHATPAAFGAHRAKRHSYLGIAGDLRRSGVDVLLGSGSKYFTDREDGADLLEEMKKSGWRIAQTPEEVRAASEVAERMVGFMGEKDQPPVATGERGMSLAEMTRRAIQVLDRKNDQGFFLMVEGSQIDWEGHDLDGPGTIAETLDFDEAVGEALRYARGREDTLVVTVADHETGGLTIFDNEDAAAYLEALGGPEKAEAMVDYADEVEETPPRAVGRVKMAKPEGARAQEGAIEWPDWGVESFSTGFGYLSMASRAYVTEPDEFWGLHTPEIIPLWAEGPGAAEVAEAQDNAEVGARLKRLIRGEKKVDRREPGGSGAPDVGPQNVILYVGDGLGMDPLTAGHYVGGGLKMRQMPVRGLVATHAADRLVGDEASAGTALFTGKRTRRGAVGMAPAGEELKSVASILERAEKSGRRTGIVTTGRLTGETVGSLYAHQSPGAAADGRSEAFVGLAERLGRGDGVDVAFGGGKEDFSARQLEALRKAGVDVGSEWGNWSSETGPTVRLLAPAELAGAGQRGGEGRAPSLATMTRRAIERLSRDGEPFLLVVEADGIGRLQRDFDRTRALVDEVVELDRAVDVGLDFAKDHGRTLVVATGDQDYALSILDNHYGFSSGVCHAAKRCGGDYALEPLEVPLEQVPDAPGFPDRKLQGEFAPPTVFLQYAWAAQEAAARAGNLQGRPTAHFTPLYAYGPWSERLAGMLDQPRIGRVLSEWATR